MGWSRDAGTLRASFQKLSRIRDEVGTQRVYRRLGENGVWDGFFTSDTGEVLAIDDHIRREL